MAEFTAITTQKQLDEVIGERIRREQETLNGKITTLEAEKATLTKSLEEANGKIKTFETEKSAFETEKGNLTKQLEEASGKVKTFESEKQTMEAKIKGYESDSVKTRIAQEIGLPTELINRITGDDEEAMKKDAESMKKLLGNQNPPPDFNPDSQGDGKGNQEAYVQMLRDIKGDE